MSTFLKYSAGLIAIYLVVANATGSGNLLRAAGATYTGGVRALQGR